MTAREVCGIVIHVVPIRNRDGSDRVTVELPAAYDYDRATVAVPNELRIMRDIGLIISYDPNEPESATFVRVAPREEATAVASQRSRDVLSAYGLDETLADLSAAMGRGIYGPNPGDPVQAWPLHMPEISIAPHLERIIREEIAKHATALANTTHQHVITHETTVTYGVRKSTQGATVGYEVAVTGTDLEDMRAKFDKAAEKVANDVRVIAGQSANQSQQRMKI